MDHLNSVGHIDFARPIGSTNGILPNIVIDQPNIDNNLMKNTVNYQSKIDSWGRRYSNDRKARRSVKSDRQDNLSDINWGMTVLANGIKVISAIMTILAADNTDRSDTYDEAVSSLLKIGASVLKLSGNYILESYSSKKTISKSDVNKIGEAVPVHVKQEEEKLSQEELFKQQQVLDFVSKLTPAQIKLQQSLVEEHVNKEAADKNLNDAQTALLLAQTLEHNGLPQISVAPSKIGFVGDTGDEESTNNGNGILNSVVAGASGIFSTLFGDSSTSEESVESNESNAGLPEPGTLAHGVTLGLFKTQQTINQIVNGISDPGNLLTNVGQVASNYLSGQPAAEDKIGEADTDSDDDLGVLGAAASLPQYISNIFGGPSAPQNAPTSELPAHVTYSKVQGGLDPTYAALGVLTTGALGSVLYSYSANSDIASSATALAKGAVDAIKRNDLVTAATSAFGSAAGDDFHEKIDHDYTNYDYYGYDEAENSYNSFYNPTGSYYDAAHPFYHDVDFRHLPYGQESYQTSFGIQQPNLIPIDRLDSYSEASNDVEYVKTEHVLKNIRPVYVAEASSQEEDSEEDLNTVESAPEPTLVNFFQPEKKGPSVPYIAYSEEHNPWNILETGQNTEHLYH